MNEVYSGKQLHNDVKDLQAIADEYEVKLNHEYWLAEAIQKDSIQNSWDARSSKKKPKGWNVKIYLLKTDKDNFLVIHDTGTTGLTGTIWKTEKELTTILKTKNPNENLAYFLSSNFSAKDSESGGKRGRGKALFLISSKDSAFYFESLRSSDDIYVCGGVFIGQDNSAMVELSLDGEYIKNILKQKINPISYPGTRIFIKNPKQELIKALNNGLIVSFIEKTWWEILKKHEGIKMVVNNGREDKYASVPIWYNDNFEDEKDLKKKEYSNLVLPNTGKELLRVKRLVLVYNPIDNTPEGIRGIAIQRRGMSIERRDTETLVKEEGMNKVYGWVEMDDSLENAMYDLEDVEHLSFKWTKNPARDLLDVIRINIRDFAKDVKLIESGISKQHKVHKEIEDEVARNINNFLKNLEFAGAASGKRRRKGKTRIPNLPLRISLAEFKTPNDNRRVNFRDKIRAQSIVINELEIPLKMINRTWIVDANGNTIRIQEKEISLNPKESFTQGWNKIVILQNEFPAGDYSFKSKITLLEDTDIDLPRIGRLEKGAEIRVSSAFSVEKDPSSHGFIKFEPVESDDKKKYISTRPETQFVVVEYNTKHPYIAKLMPIEQQDTLKKFLLEIGIIVAFNQVMAEDISQSTPKIFNDVDDNYDLTLISPRIMEEVSKFMWIQ